jgi:hypothetical protein
MTKIIRQNVSDRIVLGKSIINQAGLGKEVEILVQDGAIFILPSVKTKGWQVWEKLGSDAVEGALDNPSEKHNHYVYS